MTQMLHFPYAISPVRRDAGLVAEPQLYRSEAFGEDLLELYPDLCYDLDAAPAPRTPPAHAAGRVALVLVWATALLLASLVTLYTPLA